MTAPLIEEEHRSLHAGNQLVVRSPTDYKEGADRMIYNSPTWNRVIEVLAHDADDDVTVSARGLSVRGRLFAFLDGEEIVVDLPSPRAADLVDRSIGRRVEAPEAAKGFWVAVHDVEDWAELASEAHQFVGEPVVGRDS